MGVNLPQGAVPGACPEVPWRAVRRAATLVPQGSGTARATSRDNGSPGHDGPMHLPDDDLMACAILEARAAAARPRPDVPIGAVVADPDGVVIARAGNRREADEDPTAHAEVIALREAARVTGRWNLSGCTLVVTLEPCTMCAGAIVLSRIARVVYGAGDPKAGAAGSLYDLVREPRLNHRAEVTAGVRAQECGDLLRDFFRARRRRD